MADTKEGVKRGTKTNKSWSTKPHLEGRKEGTKMQIKYSVSLLFSLLT